MWMLYIEFIYRTTAVSYIVNSYSTSQDEYLEIFVFNFFSKSSGIRIFITFLGFRPTVRRFQYKTTHFGDMVGIDLFRLNAFGRELFRESIRKGLILKPIFEKTYLAAFKKLIVQTLSMSVAIIK